MMSKTFTTVLVVITVIFLAQCSATSSKRSFGEVVDDNVILVKLRSKFIGKKGIKSNDVGVKVWKGVVTLNGTMATQDQIDRAIEVTEQQRGVKEVRAYLVLNNATTADQTPQKTNNDWSFLSEKSEKKQKQKKDKKINRAENSNDDTGLNEVDLTEEETITTKTEPAKAPKKKADKPDDPPTDGEEDYQDLEY
ncbi:MAG: BON domain-containing protein [Deltaproteobacteria bacterium]|nr:BON domain-containing protein [Deltaproteobacteria bacterium]